MIRYATIVRNNWKKSVFITGVFSYGVFSLKSYYNISNHMRNVSNQITEFVNNKNDYNRLPKRVLVVMNPTANDKKAEKNFTKYCEPLLHLAGYSVEVFKTSHVGHAKTYVETIPVLPDAIVIAGGDGTSSEVVTGLLRRGKASCPILLLPLGRRNDTVFKNCKPVNDFDYVKSLSKTILCLIHEKKKYENVIKFDVIDIDDNNNDSQNRLKPIYGLNKFSWGVLRDIESIKDKYWYFGFLKYYAAVLLNTFSNKLNWNFSTNFEYTPPCSGCKNCSIIEPKKPSNAFRKFFSITPQVPIVNTNSYITNENCSVQHKGHVEANQLNIACKHNDEAFSELETKCINSLNPGFDFVKYIPKISSLDIEPSMTINSRTITLIPEHLKEDKKSSYSIDGEEYDVRPIKVSIIPNAIQVYCW